MKSKIAREVEDIAVRHSVILRHDYSTCLAKEFNRIEAISSDPVLDLIADLMIAEEITTTDGMSIVERHTDELHQESGHPVLTRSWDPFGDMETRGILRNHYGTNNGNKLANFEYVSIRKNMPKALAYLGSTKTINLKAWLKTHEILFSDVFPWAGTARKVDVFRGPVKFNLFHLLAKEAEAVFKKAEDPDFLKNNIGYVYGELAFNHPFLDGNGRSLNTVFTEMLRRSGLKMNWEAVDRSEYLDHLTQAVLLTNYTHLDRYLMERLQ